MSEQRMPWVALVLNSDDNVATALTDITCDSVVAVSTGDRIAVREDIPVGHKFSLRLIQAGEPVVKYGVPIGVATKMIEAGKWVHIHNVASRQTKEDADDRI